MNKNDWWVSFLEEDKVNDKTDETHNGHKILGPPPSEVAFRYETANERSEKWPRKDGHRKHGDSKTPRPVIKHVREDSCDDGERAGAEETAKESTYQDSLEILCRRDCHLEDRESEHGEDNR